jgi:hypothetical protein
MYKLNIIKNKKSVEIDAYNSLKERIIARIKAGETVPLRPDIAELYSKDPYKGYGQCSYPGAGKECWTEQFEALYKKLEIQAGVSKGGKTRRRKNRNKSRRNRK